MQNDQIQNFIAQNEGQILHNDCALAEDQEESTLVDIMREVFAGFTDDVESESLQQPITFISEEQVLQRFKELVLDELDGPGPRLEMRKFEWPAENALPIAVLLLRFVHETNYNCCVFKQRYKLSEDFRVRICKDHVDAFDSILLPCVDPKLDIESVTLLAEKVLPKDKAHSLGGEYIFQKSLCRKVLVPIKTLSGIETNRISFSSHPIFFYPNLDFWIQIKYKSGLKDLQKHLPNMFAIEVDCLHFSSEARDRVVNSVWKSLRSEPEYAPSVFLE